MMMKKKIWMSALMIALGCGVVKNVNNLLKQANQVAGEVKKALKQASTSATQPLSGTPQDVFKLPNIPAKSVGGQDLAKARPDAKFGTAKLDVDGDQTEEDTDIIFDEAENVVFLEWAGDAASDDEGICYLAWEAATDAGLIAFECDGFSDGFLACDIDEAATTCEACDDEGNCAACSSEGDCIVPDEGVTSDTDDECNPASEDCDDDTCDPTTEDCDDDRCDPATEDCDDACDPEFEDCEDECDPEFEDCEEA